MNTKTLEKITFWAQLATMLFLSFLVAILLSRQTVDSSILKTSWAFALAPVIFFLFVIRISLFKGVYKLTFLEYIVLSYYIWALLNTLFISHFRHESLLHLFKISSYVMIFFAAGEISGKKEFRDIFNYFMISLAGALITYGMMQKLGMDIFQWEGASSANRILSTFGNSIFYANFLLMLLPFIFTNLVKEVLGFLKSKKDVSPISFLLSLIIMFGVLWLLAAIAFRISKAKGGFSVPFHRYAVISLILVYALINYFLMKKLKTTYMIVYLLSASVFGVFSLIFTLSRGAWLGFIPMFIYFLFFTALFLNRFGYLKMPGKNVFFASFAVFAGIILLVFLFLPDNIKNRVKDIKLSSTTVQVRTTIWKGALRMIKAKPVGGFGSGTFQLNFPSYRPDDYSTKAVSNNTINTHCEYLQVASNMGMIGFLIFVFLGFSLVATNARYLKRLMNVDDFFFMLSLGSAILGILVHALWCVSMRFTSTIIYYYLYIGFLSGMVRFYKGSGGEEVRGKPSFALYLGLAGILIISPLWMIKADKFYVRDYFIRQGMLAEEDINRIDADERQADSYLNDSLKNGKPNGKALEFMLKISKYWYSIRAFALDARERAVFEGFFKSASKERELDPKRKYGIRIVRNDMYEFLAHKMTFEKIDAFMTAYTSIFNINYSGKKAGTRKKYLQISVDWLMSLIETGRTGFPDILAEAVEKYRRGTLSVQELDELRKVFKKFTASLKRVYNTRTVLFYNMGIITDFITYDCHYKKASAYFELGMVKEALESYDELETIAPEYTQLSYNKGVVLRKLAHSEKGDPGKRNELLQRSVDELEKSRIINPYFINTRMLLAADYEEQGKYDLANEEYMFSYRYSVDQVMNYLYPHPNTIMFRRSDIERGIQIFVNSARKIDAYFENNSRNEDLDAFKKEYTLAVEGIKEKSVKLFEEFSSTSYPPEITNEKKKQQAMGFLKSIEITMDRVKELVRSSTSIQD